jgi:hypothetical protein
MATPLSFGEVVSAGYGYTSILKAIERLILMRTPTLPNQYQANFEGITRALWDLGTVLSGAIPPPATSVIAAQPPGWNSATSSYNPGQAPGDGSFWFDTRQGRLFVSQGGEWHQTNGAEAFAHIGSTPPSRQVPGAIWFDTRQGVTFVYLDEVPSSNEPGWYQLNGGAGGGGGGGGQKALGELTNVTDVPIVNNIPADDQIGVLMRDRRSPITDKTAYRVSDRLDLGNY